VLLYLKSFAFIVIAYVKEWELHIFIVLSFVDIFTLSVGLELVADAEVV